MSSVDSPESSGSSSTPTSPSFDGAESELEAEVVPGSPGVEPWPDTESGAQSESEAEVHPISAEESEPSADSWEQHTDSS